jgi:FkbM family methyltransferase
MRLAASLLQTLLLAALPLPGRMGRKRLVRSLRRLGSPFLHRGRHGIHYLLRPGNYIDERIARDGIYEGPAVEALLAEVARRKPDLFLDIGANLGTYSLAVAMQGLCPRICAFEPDPLNRAQLCANLFLNGLAERVEVFPEAVSDAAGVATLSAQRDAGNLSTGQSTLERHLEGTARVEGIAVRTLTLDEAFPGLSGASVMVKMDIEGHEAAALRGMRRLAAANRVWLQVELLPGQDAAGRAVLGELGFVQAAQTVAGSNDYIFTRN